MATLSAQRAIPSLYSRLSSAALPRALLRLPTRSLDAPNRLPRRNATTASKPSSTYKSTTAKTVAKPAAKIDAPKPSAPPSAPFSTKSNEAPPPTARNDAVAPSDSPLKSLTDGFADLPPIPDPSSQTIDWTRSFHGLGEAAFSPEATAVLLAPLDTEDVEVKPDGILYLPEIKYRRILNKAFGPGCWGLVPRGETIVTERIVTREYGLVVHGRLVSIARGEQQFFDRDGVPTATEGCKSNALMRCCKDVGIASELWDPRFIRKFVADHVREAWVEHLVNKKRRKISLRTDDSVRYPFKEVPGLK